MIRPLPRFLCLVLAVSLVPSTAFALSVGGGTVSTGMAGLKVPAEDVASREASASAASYSAIDFGSTGYSASCSLAAFSVESTMPVVLAVETVTAVRGALNPCNRGDGYGMNVWSGTTYLRGQATWSGAVKSMYEVAGGNSGYVLGSLSTGAAGYTVSSSGATTCTPSWQYRDGCYSACVVVLIPNAGAWDVYSYSAAGVTGMLNHAAIKSYYARGVSWDTLKAGLSAGATGCYVWGVRCYGSHTDFTPNKYWYQVQRVATARQASYEEAYGLLSGLQAWTGADILAYSQAYNGAYNPVGDDESGGGSEAPDLTDSDGWWSWGESLFEPFEAFTPWLPFVQAFGVDP